MEGFAWPEEERKANGMASNINLSYIPVLSRARQQHPPSVLKAILCAASGQLPPLSGTSIGCLCEEQQWSRLCYLPEGSSRDAAVSLMSWSSLFCSTWLSWDLFSIKRRTKAYCYYLIPGEEPGKQKQKQGKLNKYTIIQFYYH